MPPSPSKPKLPPIRKESPRPQLMNLQSVEDEERNAQKRRHGYASTVMTRGGLGPAQTQKARVLGL